VRFHRQTAWRWETISLRPLARTHYMERRLDDVVRLKRLSAWWSAQRLAAKDYAMHPPHEAEWRCIHSYEAAWNDTGNPYWGGLQFGSGEWRRYGGRFA